MRDAIGDPGAGLGAGRPAGTGCRPGADHRALVDRLVAALNSHDVERFVAPFAADYVGLDIADAAPQHGRAGIRASTARYLQAFPDLRLTSLETVVERDRVVVVWEAAGTQRGPLMRIPPTLRAVRFRGVWVLDVEQGEIRRGVCIWDAAGMLRAIGLLPAL